MLTILIYNNFHDFVLKSLLIDINHVIYKKNIDNVTNVKIFNKQSRIQC